MFLKISQIKINRRIRNEYGDMEDLANSIKEYGLLHPIVVDNQYNLIAGGRRLLACERIGLKEIEAKVLGDLTVRELRLLELEENIKRKDLTEIERSKALVELAELKVKELEEKAATQEEKDVILNDTPAEEQPVISDGVRPKLGRPESITSKGKIAQEIGVSKMTLIDAQKHVAAVVQFPELEGVPKYQAIELAKQLNAGPKVVELAERRNRAQNEPKNKTLAEMENEDYYAYVDYCHKIANEFSDAIYKMVMLETDDKHLKAWKEFLGDQDWIESHIEKLDVILPKVLKMKNFLKGLIK